MTRLIESPDANTKNLRYLMCPECNGVEFRTPEDAVPFQPFKLYRQADGQLMKLMGINALFTGGDREFVCLGCERARAGSPAAGRALMLVAYDAKTVEQCEVPAPSV